MTSAMQEKDLNQNCSGGENDLLSDKYLSSNCTAEEIFEA